MKIKINNTMVNMIIIFMILLYPAIQGPLWFIISYPFRMIGIDISPEVMTGIIWIVIIIYCISIGFFRYLTRKNLALFSFLSVIAIISKLLFKYDSFTTSVLISTIFTIFPFVFLGGKFCVYKLNTKIMYIVSLITFAIAFMYQMYYLSSGRSITLDNMDFSYKMLPTVLMLFGIPFIKKEFNAWKIIISIFSVAFLFVQGTRGPILCFACFVVLLIIKKYGIIKSTILVSTVIITITILLSSAGFQEKLYTIIDKIDSSGGSSRVLVMLVSDKLTDANGRDEIQELLLNDVKSDPFAIRGLYSDRQKTKGYYNDSYSVRIEDGTYAHTIWLELIYDFGVVFGMIILLLLVFNIIKLWRITYGISNTICSIFIIIGFVHLFVSGSYLTERSFYFLLGLLINPSFQKIYTKEE